MQEQEVGDQGIIGQDGKQSPARLACLQQVVEDAGQAGAVQFQQRLDDFPHHGLHRRIGKLLHVVD